MCGRYFIDYEVDLVLRDIYESLFAAGDVKLVKGGHEVFPDTVAASLVADERSGMRPIPKRWGEKRGSYPIVINARQETILERPMFRDAIRWHRCIIPASGFYEWTKTAGKKQKYRIRTRTNGPLYMAGLYIPHVDIDRYIIVTTASNGDMQYIHHRSPLILLEGECPDYLHNTDFATERLTHPNGALQIEPAYDGEPVQLSFLDLPR